MDILKPQNRQNSSVCVCVCVCVIQWCLFVGPIDCSLSISLPMGFSRQEYWSGLPFSYSRRFSQPRDETRVSCISCIGSQILYHYAPPNFCQHTRAGAVTGDGNGRSSPEFKHWMKKNNSFQNGHQTFTLTAIQIFSQHSFHANCTDQVVFF